MTRSLLCVAVIAGLAAGCRKAPAAAPPAAPQPGAQALALRERLAQRDFKGLEAELLGKQAAFEKAPAAEDASWSAVEAFTEDDPATEALLDDWVRTSDAAQAALAARAAYHYSTGWRRRGHASRAQTSEAQLEQMASSFTKAEQDCNAALDRNPGLAYCHTLLIRLAGTQGERSETERRLTRGREAAPTSFMVRLAYLQSLTPRWGGSYEGMTAFAQESAAEASRNPRFRNLSAYVPADKAWMAELSDDPSAAVRFYTEALALGQEAAIYAGRAGAQYELKRYDLAALDLNRALELGPEGWHHSNTSLVDALTYRGVALSLAGDQGGAIRDVQRALALDRRHEYAHEMWSYIHQHGVRSGRRRQR